MKEPTLSEDGDNGGFGFEQELDLGIGGGFDVGSASGAESSEFTGAPGEFSCLGKKSRSLSLDPGQPPST